MADLGREAAARSFGAAAQVYDRARATYPLEAVRWLLPPGAARVLDLAAGTGRLSALLLDLGLDVVAVEPDDAMRALVPAGARALAGTAEQVPLPDADVDAVLVGQAWHWFDEDRALAEVRRVLRPGGVLGLLWNVFDDRVPWVAELVALTEAGDRLSAEDELPEVAGLTGELRRFVHVQAMTRDLLVENVASRSGTLLLSPQERSARLARVRELAPADAFDLTWVCHVVRLVPG